MKSLSLIVVIIIFSLSAHAYAQDPSGRLDGSYWSVGVQSPAIEEPLPDWQHLVVSSEDGVQTYILNSCSFSVRLKPQGACWIGTLIDDDGENGMDGVGCARVSKHAKDGDEFVKITPVGEPDKEGRVTLFQHKVLIPAMASEKLFGQYYKLVD